MFDCIQGSTIFKAVGSWLLFSCIIGFFAMGIDKDRAIHHEWRIPEKTLFIIAAIGGSFGMAVGSELFNHKSSKLRFLAIIYGCVAAWFLILQRVGFLGCLLASIPR